MPGEDDGASLEETRRHNPIRSLLNQAGLYHSFVLPDGRVLRGAMDPDIQRQRLESFALPDRLDGKRVLDIGPWDGFFTFEMERRGAEVTAVDYVDLDTFRLLRSAFGSSARYLQLDVSELRRETVGTFDIVLCLGVLYHLRYPLEGLERVCAITTDVCIVESFVADGGNWLEGGRPPIAHAEFYERAELGEQLDNWWGPSVSAVAAWIRTAGFASAELRRVTENTACFLAHRKWRNLPPDRDPAIRIAGLSHHLNRGRTFRSNKEEYIELWIAWAGTDTPSLDSVFPEVDGFGIAPLFCNSAPNCLHVSFRVPPGLSPGEHRVRLKIGEAAWSNTVIFYLDLPPIDNTIAIGSVQNGMSWEKNQVSWEQDGWMTVWLSGLSAEADPGNVTVFVSGIPHDPWTVMPETGQVNVRLRRSVGGGAHSVHAVHRGAVTNSCVVQVDGEPPPVHGLENL